MGVDAREEALKVHAELTRLVAEMCRVSDELTGISRQLSFDNTVAQNAEIMARYHVGHKQLLEMGARRDELMRTMFDLLGLPYP